MMNLTKLNLNGIEVVNMTPHTINLYKEDGEIVNIPPSGVVSLIDSIEKKDDRVTNFMKVNCNSQELGNLYFKVNDEKVGIMDVLREIKLSIPITSGMSRQAMSSLMEDAVVLSPNTGDSAIRDKGKIIGTKGWIVSGDRIPTIDY